MRTIMMTWHDDYTYQWSARVVFSISRREWEFLLFYLAHRDETENLWHLVSGFETRLRKNFLQSRASRRDRDFLSSFSGFKTKTRILLIWSQFSRREREFYVANFPWIIRLERPWQALGVRLLIGAQAHWCCHRCKQTPCCTTSTSFFHLEAYRSIAS